MQGLDDTIAAIATAPGAAGLAVVRVSGGRALAVADAVFDGAAALAGVASHTLHHGWARSAARDRIDEVVAAVFRSPRSYTREDVVELSCHGGTSAARLLEALLEAGARLAGPGEFTLRAFLNGRLDLAQAEAVADVIHAETEGARVLALAQLAGELSRRLEAVRAPLEDLLAEVEARVDFAEDVGGIEIPPNAVDKMAAADSALASLLEGAAFARAMREGVRVPLVGTPNVGKSSLFNALVGEERAIVTAEPGTTRDRVSEPVEIAGIRIVLSDTAGLRDAVGEVEALGVARSREVLAESPLVMWVVDGSRPLQAADREIGDLLGGGAKPSGAYPGVAGAAAGAAGQRRVLVALNKSDLAARVTPREISGLMEGAAHRVVPVSARSGQGLAPLREALTALAGGGEPMASAVSNSRHVEALARARAALARAAATARGGEPGEIVAIELRESLVAIGEVTGQTVGEDLLDRIFARFCVGK